MSKYTIGVDLGGTNIAVGLVNEKMEIVATISDRTNLPRPAKEVEASIAELCRKVAQKAGVDFSEVKYVGIGTPGSVNAKTGVVAFNANFGYENWHVTEGVSALLGCTVMVENDANAAAYGEFVAGAARGAKDAILITLGTGIGGGIIVDGKIYSGFNGVGGEVGHNVIVAGGRPCTCGRRGCWEKYASSRALTEDTREAMRQHTNNMMWDLAKGSLENVNARIAFDGMRAGDELAREVVDNFIEYVACGVINLINTFQPELLVVGGGISREGETLLAPVRAIVDKEDYARNMASRTKIVAAQLFNDAGIIGAALLGEQFR